MLKTTKMRYNEPFNRFEIIGVYQGETAETLDTATSYKEARFLAQEYAIEYGANWDIFFLEI